jgi:plasmid stabilization system protein ParE
MPDSARLYRLSPRAERDLEDIWLYAFENWSVEQADRYQNQIMAAIETLANGSRRAAPSTAFAPATENWPRPRISCSIASPTPGLST